MHAFKRYVLLLAILVGLSLLVWQQTRSGERQVVFQETDPMGWWASDTLQFRLPVGKEAVKATLHIDLLPEGQVAHTLAQLPLRIRASYHERGILDDVNLTPSLSRHTFTRNGLSLQQVSVPLPHLSALLPVAHADTLTVQVTPHIPLGNVEGIARVGIEIR